MQIKRFLQNYLMA